MLGSGVFVTAPLAVELAGTAAILSLALAGLLAFANALGSAQLAASHPVSGGAYEYGYVYASPELGWTAGWLFLIAKSASAATALLGFAEYARMLAPETPWFGRVPVAFLAGFVLTILVASGVRRSTRANTVLIAVPLAALGVFVVVALASSGAETFTRLTPFFPAEQSAASGAASTLRAAALFFVAYTGYGRIATMGEEVHEPGRTIPRAITVTVIASFLLYAAVVVAAIGAVGVERVSTSASSAAPLGEVARDFAGPWLSHFVTAGAACALLGVSLNLLLGLSRVLLAMARRGDAPAPVGVINAARTSAPIAVLTVGVLVGLLVLVGDVRTTWSLSAFTVLVYYAINNFCALRLSDEQRLYPRWISTAALAGCLSLAVWVDWRSSATGLSLIAIGLVWRVFFRAWTARRRAARG